MNMAQTSPFQHEAQHPLQGYVERFHTLQQYSDSKDELIKDLLRGWSQAANELAQENEHLKKSVENLQFDLESAVESRRELQSRLRNSERQIDRFMHDNDGLKNRNPYVMVLIDGDGLIFQEHWVKMGIEGGKKAAYALRAAILERFENDDVEVMAKVVANVGGLGKALVREGSLYDEATLRDFTLGFTQAKAAFDFVDVGYGKERADSKIKEMTRWNLRSHNCKQVFLGVSHDSGYAPFLDEILQDEDTRRRVTLLEGFPTVRELKATGVAICNELTATIFRTDKIVANPSNGYANGHTRREEIATTSTSPSLRSASPPAMPVLPSNGSWAVVTGGASPPPKLTTPLANRLPPPSKTNKEAAPKWSPGARGLDAPVYATADALEAIKNRDKNDKYCNNFYLRGNCAKRYNGCLFNHEAKPTTEELNALKLLTRTNPCGAGQDCYVEDCIYGHHCPSVKDGICPHPYCKFPKDLHPPGTRFANKKIDYN